MFRPRQRRRPARPPADRRTARSLAGGVVSRKRNVAGVRPRGNGGVTPFPPVASLLETGSPVWFGCDYLRLTFGDMYESGILDRFFFGLSANSNEKSDQYFLGTRGFKFHALFFLDKKVGIFSYKNTTVIEITKMLNSGALKNCSWMVTFYSSAFHIDEMKPVICKALRLWNGKCRISRCDIAIDLVCSVNELYESRITNFRKEQIIANGGVIETFYLGAKVKNKKHFLRVYDKKLDSQKKGKFGLFGHYIKRSEPITRVEAEVRVQSCDQYGIMVEDILEVLERKPSELFGSKLFRVLLSVSANPDGTFLSRIADLRKKTGVVLLRQRKIGKKKLDDDLTKIKYARVMLGYARNLRLSGFDPIAFLKKEIRKRNPKRKNLPSSSETSRHV